METKNVILDFSITDYSDAEACDERNLVHRSKLDSFMDVFKEQLLLSDEELRRWNDGIREVRNIHNAISVYASRGAGKTTFLLSAMKKIKSLYKEKVVVLDTIDPSLIDSKQKPIVNIIAAIHEKVREAACRIDVFCDKEEKELRQRLENHYKEVMKALPFMDGIGKEPVYADWDDEEYISDQGIEKAIACNNLEKAFQYYLYDALKLMKKSCFVIPFDDIDTDFKKGYEILEIIRKYLTTPFIITVLTGDLELYGKLVRRESWRCFDDELMTKELNYASRKPEEFSTIINQLENQYLVKILKPEYRISICTMREYMEDEDYRLSILVKFEQSEDPISIDDCYQKFLGEIGFNQKNISQIRSLSNFLLGLSMRIQIRLLRQIKTIYSTKTSLKHHSLSDGVMHVFWNDLNQKASNAKGLMRSSEWYTMEMLKFLTYTRSLDESCGFMPETGDDILNKALFSIGTKFHDLSKRYPHLVIDFWMRISYVSFIVNQLLVERSEENEQSILREKRRNQLIDYAGFKSNQGLTDCVCKSLAYYNSVMRPPYESYIEPIAGVSLLNNVTPLMLQDGQYQLALLPLFGIVDAENHDIVYISIFKYLALISEMIISVKEYKECGMENDYIANYLINKCGQYKIYIEPSITPKVPGEETKEDGGMHFIYQDRDENSAVVSSINSFVDWIDTLSTKINISCDLLDKIFTRFYHTLIHIEESRSDMPTGQVFNLYIISFLNSVLVEEALNRQYNRLILNNSGDIEYVYALNLSRAFSHSTKQRREMFTLHTWISECPLLRVFLNPLISYVMEDPEPIRIQYFYSWKRYQQLVDINEEKQNDLRDILDRKKLLDDAKKGVKNLRDIQRKKEDMQFYESIFKMRKEFLDSNDLEKYQAHIKELQNTIDVLNDEHRRPVVIDDLNINLSIDSDMHAIDNAMNTIVSEIGRLEAQEETISEEIKNNKSMIKKHGGFALDEYKKLQENETVFKVLNTYFSNKKPSRDITPF